MAIALPWHLRDGASVSKKKKLSFFHAVFDQDERVFAEGSPRPDLHSWYEAQGPHRSLVLLSSSDEMLAHGAIRENTMRPDGEELSAEMPWEITMVAVHPSWRGQGLATQLVRELAALVDESCWAATPLVDPADGIFASLDWHPHHSFVYPSGLRGTVWSNLRPPWNPLPPPRTSRHLP